MKLSKMIPALLSCAVLLCGCGAAPAQSSPPENTEAPAENTTASAPASAEETASAAETAAAETTAAAAEIDYDSLSEDEYRQLIVDRSLLTVGDTARMESVLKRAENGETITYACIGGSITEGLTAGADACWAKLSYDWLCERLPGANINFVNAGMSGTPSTLGVIRFERDLIEPYGAPDIVVVEFAVNDGNDTLSKNAYESLVRRALSLKEDTAVVLLFTVLKNGYSCETSHMKTVGEQYDLPMISVGTALNEEFESGRTPWEKYSDDESHPNEWGHVLVKDFMANYFTAVLDGAGGEKPVNDISGVSALYGADYTGVHMYDSTSLTALSLGEYSAEKETISQFPHGWSRKGGDNEGITFEIACKDLFVVYQCNKSPKFGTADVYIDGELSASVKSFAEDGWNNPVAQLIYSGDEAKTHTVTFKMQDGQEDTYFGILALGYTD